MTHIPFHRLQRARSIARGCGLSVATGGLLVLVGWFTDTRILVQPIETLASMKANTAFTFVLVGALLASVRPGVTGPSAAAALGTIVAAIAGVTLSQDLFGWNLGIDEALVRDGQTGGTSAPGRMAPATAVCFMAIGIALARASRRRSSRLTEWLAIFVGALAAVAIVGYLFDARAFYGIGPYTTMAIHTAILFAVLASGVLLLQPKTPLMVSLLADGAGPSMARRLVPAALAVPMVAGSLRLAGQRAGWFGTEFGLALLVVTMMMAMTALILLTTRSVMAADDKREAAEDDLNVLSATLERRVEERARVSAGRAPSPPGTPK